MTGASTPPIVRGQMPELDVMRGIAVLMVVFYHGFFWSNASAAATPGPIRALVAATQAGWLGVDLFFILSGFLITGILLDSREREDFYRRFYYRRALRILPAYLALLLLLIVSGVVHWKFALISSLFAANIAPLVGAPMEYGPLWSLAVEEQWYLLWPTAVRRLTRRTLAMLAGLVVCGSWALRLTAFRRGWTDGLYAYTWFTADGLAIGALLAIGVRSPRATRHRLGRAALMLFFIGVVILAVGLPHGILTRTRPLGAALQRLPFLLMFAAALLGVLLIGTSRNAKFVQSSFLSFFGEISYGLYLVHLLIFFWYDAILHLFGADDVAHRSAFAILTRFTIASGASVIVAYASRRSFEEWFLRHKNRAILAGRIRTSVPQMSAE